MDYWMNQDGLMVGQDGLTAWTDFEINGLAVGKDGLQDERMN